MPRTMCRRMMREDRIEGCRVLITGGAGFIGSHLAEALYERNEVIVLDDLSSGRRENLRGKEVELVLGSIRDPDLVRRTMEGVDYVFHHAAIASVPKSLEDPIASNQVNVCGTLRVLSEARDAKVRKVVFASSASVYGNAPTKVKREEDNPAPISPYAVTKLTGEFYCFNFWANFGLPTCCLRYFNVYGPRQDPTSEYAAAVPRFIEAARNGDRLTIYGDGEQTRDFTYVGDVVQANILAALDVHHPGAVYNIARQEGISVNELARTILELFGRSAEGGVLHLPPRQGDVRHSMADISRARADLGYCPRIDLRQGLALTVQADGRS
jgi:UDP-glucose 4-epimerase